MRKPKNLIQEREDFHWFEESTDWEFSFRVVPLSATHAHIICRHFMVRVVLSNVIVDKCMHGVPLVDRSVQVGTFKRFAENFHQVYDPDLSRASYKWMSHYVHVLCGEDKLVFLCIATLDIPKEHAFFMLGELKIQFQNDFSQELQRHSRQRNEMDTEFGSYVERTIKRFNKTWAETDLMALGDSADPHGQIVEIELDPMRTRKRIKTPLLAQSTGDIHRSVVKSQTKTLGACNRCLLRFPCIMVSICIFLGMFVLLYFIFILPSCGALLKKPNCILFRKPGQILAPPTPL